MTEVIGVRFRTAGKIYYFAPADIEFNRGEHAIVETARGVEYGFVVMGNRSMDDSKIVQPLKPVIRKATKEDDLRHEENSSKRRKYYDRADDKGLRPEAGKCSHRPAAQVHDVRVVRKIHDYVGYRGAYISYHYTANDKQRHTSYLGRHQKHR